MKKMKILIATNNQGKIKEYKQIYAELSNLEFVTPNQMGIQIEVEETGHTYKENAILKALAFAKASNIICLADDSGIEVDALDGAPGIYSARFSPIPHANDADRRKHLISQIGNAHHPWSARFKCTIAIADPVNVLAVYEGICEGEIIPEDRGQNGFGYDPCFLVQGYEKTMAELSEEIKNQISHRARAAQKTIEYLKSLS